MNRLVPYLDLFLRLDDAELSRLAGVEVDLVATLRRQVVEIGEGLAQYLDLLPRLGDEELIRLTGASAKTIRFWRLCQPRTSPARTGEIAARAETSSRPSGPEMSSRPSGPEMSSRPSGPEMPSRPSGPEMSSVTPMPRPVPPPREATTPPAARDDAPTQLRRRTTGVGMQATMVAGGAPSPTPSPPIANWSHEASGTNAATTITPPPHQLTAASWDTTSPSSGTETMITPIGQTPEAMWGQAQVPSETTTLPAGAARPQPARPRVDPSESQQAAARALDINGEPFPGYEWQIGMSEDDPAFSLSDLDH